MASVYEKQHKPWTHQKTCRSCSVVTFFHVVSPTLLRTWGMMMPLPCTTRWTLSGSLVEYSIVLPRYVLEKHTAVFLTFSYHSFSDSPKVSLKMFTCSIGEQVNLLPPVCWEHDSMNYEPFLEFYPIKVWARLKLCADKKCWTGEFGQVVSINIWLRAICIIQIYWARRSQKTTIEVSEMHLESPGLQGSFGGKQHLVVWTCLDHTRARTWNILELFTYRCIM